ncbi:MAG: 2Fe-2S iron-sulfur cluster binding domain-containing protein [Deltaproteobacteria bacterium]|nr:2Fe-2S iron-sulfur cluster binding domain-containing protein [Deltaproteobacteria bacterium]
MIYVVSLIVFSAVIFTLVGMLLLVEAKVVKSDDCMIVINDDEDKPLKVPGGPTLLSVLTANHIFLPSACGGGGSCGTCKCVVEEGGAEPASAWWKKAGEGFCPQRLHTLPGGKKKKTSVFPVR